MIIKLLEVRDEATCFGVMAISIDPDNEQQRAIIRHAGFSDRFDAIIMLDMHSCEGSYDPFKQPNYGRTRRDAHLWIREHFEELKDGDVVDVQFILGETGKKKEAEIQRNYGDQDYARSR